MQKTNDNSIDAFVIAKSKPGIHAGPVKHRNQISMQGSIAFGDPHLTTGSAQIAAVESIPLSETLPLASCGNCMEDNARTPHQSANKGLQISPMQQNRQQSTVIVGLMEQVPGQSCLSAAAVMGEQEDSANNLSNPPAMRYSPTDFRRYR